MDNQGMIALTGATGFTGNHLLRRLLQDGHRVRALVRNPSDAPTLQALGAEPLIGDLRDSQACQSLVQNCDTVYHIAANFRNESITRDDMFAINAGGTRHMLEASEKAGVSRFVHCSTVGVHGDVKHPPATETTPFAPGDWYQESKLEGELIAQRFQKNSEMDVTVFRPAGIYGAGEMRFLKLFKLAKGNIMIGQGKPLYQMIHINDLVEGIILCATHPSAANNTFILTGEPPLLLKDLISKISKIIDTSPPQITLPIAPVYAAATLCETICKPLNIEPPLYRRRVDFFTKDRAFSIQKAKDILGFAPQVSLEDGLQETADYYLQNDLL